jgi:hypothetical protein
MLYITANLFKLKLNKMDGPFSALDRSTVNHISPYGARESLAGKLRVVDLNSHLHLLPRFYHRSI